MKSYPTFGTTRHQDDFCRHVLMIVYDNCDNQVQVGRDFVLYSFLPQPAGLRLAGGGRFPPSAVPRITHPKAFLSRNFIWS